MSVRIYSMLRDSPSSTPRTPATMTACSDCSGFASLAQLPLRESLRESEQTRLFHDLAIDNRCYDFDVLELVCHHCQRIIGHDDQVCDFPLLDRSLGLFIKSRVSSKNGIGTKSFGRRYRLFGREHFT